MATGGGILPTYQQPKFVSGVPTGIPITRRTLRIREKYVLGLVGCVFGFVCFGAIFFLPDMRDRVSSDGYIGPVEINMNKLFIPRPGADDSKVAGQQRLHDDQQKFFERVQRHPFPTETPRTASDSKTAVPPQPLAPIVNNSVNNNVNRTLNVGDLPLKSDDMNASVVNMKRQLKIKEVCYPIYRYLIIFLYFQCVIKD